MNGKAKPHPQPRASASCPKAPRAPKQSFRTPLSQRGAALGLLLRGPHPELAGSRAQQRSCSHLEPGGACPTPNLCAWGQPGGRSRGSSLRPCPQPRPGAEGQGAGGQGGPLAAPGTVPLGKVPARPRGVFQLGEAGSPLRTRVCKALASPAFRSARGPGRRSPCGPGGVGRGPGARLWPGARRVQTGPRQPNPADRARGGSQG